jgi:hypothetical protein
LQRIGQRAIGNPGAYHFRKQVRQLQIPNMTRTGNHHGAGIANPRADLAGSNFGGQRFFFAYYDSQWMRRSIRKL